MKLRKLLKWKRDISNIDNKKSNFAITIIQSYSRNLYTLTENKTIYKDVKTNCNMSEPTFYDYIQALEKLFIIEDIEAWCPSIRSKSAIRTGKKRNFVDPSIAVAALGVASKYFDQVLKH